MTKPTVMLIGPGDLGGVVLELLARSSRTGRIIVGGRKPERGRTRCNLARVGAVAQGFNPSIEFIPLDLNKPQSVADAVHRHHPDLILSTATMQTWWLPNLLPAEPSALIKSAGFGMWLPIHLTLTLKLMRALEEADFDGVSLTAPYPDVINPILCRLGLAPTCGVGNVGEIEPKVRALAAEQLHVPHESLRIYLVAHHAMVSVAYGSNSQSMPPYFLRVEQNDTDVTQTIRADELLSSPYALPPGPATHFLTAGSVVRLIDAFASDEETLLHAPAPNGLPGGYPVLVSRRGVKPAPLPGLSLEQAVDINERSHPFDGIERIEEDGTAVFSPRAVEIFRDLLGYHCDRLAPGEAEQRANELIARFREYAARYGVNV